MYQGNKERGCLVNRAYTRWGNPLCAFMWKFHAYIWCDIKHVLNLNPGTSTLCDKLYSENYYYMYSVCDFRKLCYVYLIFKFCKVVLHQFVYDFRDAYRILHKWKIICEALRGPSTCPNAQKDKLSRGPMCYTGKILYEPPLESTHYSIFYAQKD